MSTINNAIPFVPENTTDPAAGLNLSINQIDALMQVRVHTVGENAPPAGVEGQRHIVGTAPTGAWAGQANRLARYLDGAWSFYDARVVLSVDGVLYVRPDAAWVAFESGGAEWGEIVGSLGDQADLQQALDGKVNDDDSRLTDSRQPSGGAGGVLSGTYPNPGFAVDMATQQELDTVATAKVDKVAGKGLSTEDYTTEEKDKLGGIASGAQVNVATNLAQGTRTATAVPVTSSTGASATLGAATGTLAGVMVAADKAKLDGVATGATANATDAQLRDRSTHTGTQAATTVTIADVGNYFAGTNAETVLQEVGALIGNTAAALDSINGEVV